MIIIGFSSRCLKQSRDFLKKISKVISEAPQLNTVKTCVEMLNMLMNFQDPSSAYYGDYDYLVKTWKSLKMFNNRGFIGKLFLYLKYVNSIKIMREYRVIKFQD